MQKVVTEVYPHQKNLSLKSFRKILRYFCIFIEFIEEVRQRIFYVSFSFRNDSNNFYKSSKELLDDLKNILNNKIEPKLLNLFHKKPSAKLLIEGKESIKRSDYDNEIFLILFILKEYLMGLQAVTCRVLWTEADQGNSSPILETTRPNLNMK